MWNNRLSTERKALVLMGAAVLALGLTLATVICPMFQQIQANEEQLQDLRASVDNYKQLAAVENYEQQHAGQTKQLELLRNRLPQELTVAVAIQRLYALAESCGVKIEAANLQGKEYAKSSCLSLQVKLGGAYHKVLNFITTLEQQGVFISLERFVLKGKETDGNVELNMQANIYQAQR